MCLIVFAKNAHPRYKFVLAANRDEFYARPTAPAAFWSDAPQIVAGKDLTAGGTWLGFTKNGRFAAVTNYRDPFAPTGEKSRGRLTRNFLTGSDSPENYLRAIEKAKNDYSGFNLLVGNFSQNKNELFYFSNQGEEVEKLSNGIYGLSNARLDTDWHKVETSKAKFTETLQTSDEIQHERLFEILADRRAADDDKLPDTGVGIERERILSSAFIETENYGTRSSTVLLVEHTGKVIFIEKTFVGAAREAGYEFLIES